MWGIWKGGLAILFLLKQLHWPRLTGGPEIGGLVPQQIVKRPLPGLAAPSRRTVMILVLAIAALATSVSVAAALRPTPTPQLKLPSVGSDNSNPGKARPTSRVRPAVSNPESPADGQKYWTEKRMREAKPVRVGPAGTAKAPATPTQAKRSSARDSKLTSTKGSASQGDARERPAVTKPSTSQDDFWTKERMRNAEPGPGSVLTGSPNPVQAEPPADNPGGGGGGVPPSNP